MAETIIAVPSIAEVGLRKLVRLSDGQVEELLAAINKEPPTLVTRDYVTHLATRIKGITQEDLQDMMDALATFSTGPGSLGLSTTEFIDAILRGSNIDIPTGEQERAKTNLAKLLDSETLALSAKAANLSAEYPHTFASARIFTDIRPVFQDDPSKPPVGAIVVHTLKISFHSGPRHQEFYVALDATDLGILREVIERAEAKANGLVSILNQANITHVRDKSQE